jgi:hypothetical protein
VRIVCPTSVPVGRPHVSTPTPEPVPRDPSSAHQHKSRAAAAVSVMVPTGMRLGDRDNLVRIAHALFYVALVLALLWMFSCQWHARCSSFRYESLRIVTRMTTLILHLDVEEDKTDGNSGFR